MPSLYPALRARPGWTYLDSAATSLLHDDVLQVVQQSLMHGGSAGRGSHGLASQATTALSDARATVADHLSVSPRDVVFVRSATEGLNLVAHGWGRQNLLPGDRVLVTQMEHHSNLLPWRAVASEVGAVVDVVGCTPTGDLDMASLTDLLRRRPRVLALTHVSNVTGACVALPAVVEQVRAVAPECLIVVDGTQAVPHRTVDLSTLGVDAYVFSGHKAHGPLGAGVVWAKSERWEQTHPLLRGGGAVSEVGPVDKVWAEIPWRFEAGTPNHPAIEGLAKGLSLCASSDRRFAAQAATALASIPGVRVLGHPADRVGCVSWVHAGIHPHDVAGLLNAQSIAVRAGHLCAQPYLAHLGATAAVRASFGPHNEAADVERLVTAVRCAHTQFRGAA